MKNKLICFDVDGTLVEAKSSWATLTLGLGASAQRISEIYLQTESGRMPFDVGVAEVKEMFCQTGKASKDFIQNIFERVQPKSEAGGLIDYLKQKNYLIYLISGGIDAYVATIARKIGADGFFGHASLEFDANGMLCQINYGRNQNQAKVARLNELSQKFYIPVEEIIFAGDSANDLGAFQITKHGIAVEPFDEILQPASWKTVKSLLEIKNIL